jgi:hypothetical protein
MSKHYIFMFFWLFCSIICIDPVFIQNERVERERKREQERTRGERDREREGERARERETKTSRRIVRQR